jgi:hypothetical protein
MPPPPSPLLRCVVVVSADPSCPPPVCPSRLPPPSGPLLVIDPSKPLPVPLSAPSPAVPHDVVMSTTAEAAAIRNAGKAKNAADHYMLRTSSFETEWCGMRINAAWHGAECPELPRYRAPPCTSNAYREISRFRCRRNRVPRSSNDTRLSGHVSARAGRRISSKMEEPRDVITVESEAAYP